MNVDVFDDDEKVCGSGDDVHDENGTDEQSVLKNDDEQSGVNEIDGQNDGDERVCANEPGVRQNEKIYELRDCVRAGEKKWTVEKKNVVKKRD